MGVGARGRGGRKPVNRGDRPERPVVSSRSARAGGRTRLGRAFSRVSWVVAAGLLAASACWTISDAAWSIDLVANLSAQVLTASGAATVLWLLTGRRGCAAAGLLACVLSIAGLSIGRAAILPRPLEVRGPRGDGGGAATRVRLFHYNASTRGDGPEIEAAMAASDADVLSVLCPPVAHQRSIIYGRGLEDRYPGKLVRPFREDPATGGADITAAAIFSRWPMRRVDTAWAGPGADYLITGIVERPANRGGAFAVIGVHPRSPRSPARWRLGNEVVRVVASVATRLRNDGYPVAVLADLNATPSGHRSRLLFSDAQLRRAKPLMVAAGTYPIPLGPGDDLQRGPPRRSWWPLSVALDDVLVSPGIEVVGWGFLPRLASEHKPILVEVDIRGGPEIRPPPPNR